MANSVSDRFAAGLTRLVIILSALVLAAIAGHLGWTSWLFLSSGAKDGNVARIAITLGYVALLAAFVLPGLRRRILAATARPGARGPVIVLATIVLFFPILIPLVAVAPNGWPLAGTIGFAVAYAAVFIFPGYAYRPWHAPRSKGGVPVKGPSWVIRSPVLRRLGILWVVVFLGGLGLTIAGMLFIRAAPSPGWLRTVWLTLPLTTLVLAAPLLAIIRSMTWTGGTGGLDSPTGQRVMLIASGLLVCGLIAWQVQTKAFVWGWNRLTEAPIRAQAFTVLEAKPRSGLKGCGARIIARAQDRPEEKIDLCNYSRDFVASLKPGDTIATLARESRFGMSEIRLGRWPGPGGRPSP